MKTNAAEKLILIDGKFTYLAKRCGSVVALLLCDSSGVPIRDEARHLIRRRVYTSQLEFTVSVDGLDGFIFHPRGREEFRATSSERIPVL